MPRYDLRVDWLICETDDVFPKRVKVSVSLKLESNTFLETYFTSKLFPLLFILLNKGLHDWILNFNYQTK